MSQFQKDFESLNLQHQVQFTEKKTQLEVVMNILQSQPQLDKFINESLDVNAKLKQQQEVFFQQYYITSSYCDPSEILIQQVAIQKLECENIEKKINEHIQWQASDSGKEANLPQVDKFHKEILFKDWEAQIKQAEKETTKAFKLAKEITESVCEQIVKAELIKECTSEVIS